MIYVKPASKYNPLDIVAAKWLREEGDATPVSWVTHLEWWFAQGYWQMWFACTSWHRRVGYVRVNKANVVSIAISQEYRAGGIGLRLLDHIRPLFTDTLTAYVATTNKASFNLFRKAGYEPVIPVKQRGALLWLESRVFKKAA